MNVEDPNQGELEKSQKEHRKKNRDKYKEADKEYRTKNRDKIRESQKRCKKKNPDKYHEVAKVYRMINRDKLNESQREYRKKNLDKYKEVSVEYRMKNQAKIKEGHKEFKIKNQDKYKEVDKGYRTKNKDMIGEYRMNNKDMIKEYYINNKLKIREIGMNRMIEKNPNYLPNYSWRSSHQSRHNFESLAQIFHISDLSDWYRISSSQIKQIGGGIINKFGSLKKALAYAYPEYPWDSSKFAFRGKKSTQRWLFIKVKELIPNSEIIEDYYHPDLVWEKRERSMQLDIWVPEYNLAIEYQGEHHYYDIHSAYGTGSTSKMFLERDEEKKRMCIEKGVFLVCIPYWWDRKLDSLSSTLNQTLPNIFPKTDSPPIPTSPPKKKVAGNSSIPSSLMQGLDRHNEDPTGWYMSEKLDGIRAYWDGTQLWSKNGRVINVPESFKEGLPDFHLDGELWGGYIDCDRIIAKLRTICGTTKRSLSSLFLNEIKFCVFDAPQQSGHYRERHSFLQNQLSQLNHPFLSLIPMSRCDGINNLEIQLKVILDRGGEGIMLYHPDTPYEPGRTRNLLKVKNYLESNVKFLKLSSTAYYFICEQENGKTSRVKCSGGDYDNPPPYGTVITTNHIGFFNKSQKLKHPILAKLRYDLNWEDLLLLKNKE